MKQSGPPTTDPGTRRPGTGPAAVPGFGAALLSTLVLLFTGCSQDTPPPPEPSPEPVPSFVVALDTSDPGAPALRITHRANPSRVLWESVPGEPFVRAAEGEETLFANRGSYDITDRIVRDCPVQTVDREERSGGAITLSGTLSGPACDTAYTLRLSEVSENQLAFDLDVSGTDPEINRVFLAYASDPDEGFFGFGMQFTDLNLKGRRFPVIVQEQGIGRGEQPITAILDIFSPGSAGDWWTTYAVTPQYFTTRGRSLFLENTEITEFDMEQRDRVRIRLYGTRLRGRILHGETPLDLVREFTAYAGRMQPLPDWINEGAVAGLQGGTERVYEKLAELEAYETPLAAFWLQDWVGRRRTPFGSNLWWNWTLDEERYPGWDEMVADLRARGVRVMTYINPYLAKLDEPLPGRPDMFREAAEKGYLVRDETGAPYIETSFIDFGIVDLTNPAAREWYKGVIRTNLIGSGASGWMADYGESLPFDAVLHSGEDPWAYHNVFPEVWQELNQEAVAEAGLQDEIVTFARSGYTRNPGVTRLVWMGDQLTSWDGNDGIKSAVKGMLSGGFSGLSLTHSDIGGYTNIPLLHRRSRNLLLRWMELAAFTCVYRTHEGLRPEENAQFYTDEETHRHFAAFARVFRALAFHRRKLMREAAASGAPVMRHPILHYPDDPAVYALEYQWMLGPDFMVAPVLDDGADTVDVYLPEGRWVHVWTGAVYASPAPGQWHRGVPAPLGQPGVFHLEGSPAGATFRENLTREGLL
jgi:sulfoquinovosidase